MARPKPKFTSPELKQIENMAKVGLNYDKIAIIMGKSRSTFYTMLERDRQAFDDGTAGEDNLVLRLERGRAVADRKLVTTAYDMAVSGKHAVMTIFMCKSRLHWSDQGQGNEDQTEKPVIYEVSIDRSGKFEQSKPRRVES